MKDKLGKGSSYLEREGSHSKEEIAENGEIIQQKKNPGLKCGKRGLNNGRRNRGQKVSWSK